MKKLLLTLILVVLFVQPLSATALFTDLRDQVKMTLAQREPEFTDDIIDDFLILAIQNAASNGLAYRHSASRSCDTDESNEFDFCSPLHSHKGQGLFVDAVTKYVIGTTHKRSIWEISPNSLARKWLINPPPFQYYYIWHRADSSFFSLFDPPDESQSLTVHSYFVPLTFSSNVVAMPLEYDDIVIEFTLFLCYIRLKDWEAALTAFNKYSANLSVIRELHINKRIDVTFGPQIIEP
jgi:hypothetical protein